MERLQRRAVTRQGMAFAKGTVANRKAHLRLYLSFAIYFDLPAFPASTATLRLFLEYLTLTYKSVKAVTNVFSSLRFHHESLGHDTGNFQHLQVRLALRSLRFTMRAHPAPAVAFPRQLLAPLVRAAAGLGRWGLPFQALVVFAFCTFARLSSLVPVSAAGFDATRWPTVGSLLRDGDFATLRISYSKTRQAADGGFLVPMRASNAPPCPVALAQALLDRAARLRLPPSAPLFSAESMQQSEPLISLSQAAARSLLHRCLQLVGLPPRAYSFHSFRRGGCSSAFAGGAHEADLARHGDWRSTAVRRYYPAYLSRQRVAGVLAGTGPPLPPLSPFGASTNP